MTDGQTLYWVLFSLYVLEGAAWVPRGSLALRARSPARAVPALPHRTIGNVRGGAVMGYPFLPGATVFVVPQWPVSLSPDAALGWVAECLELAERAPQTGLSRKLGAIERVEVDGREVRVDGELLVEAASPSLARRVAAEIERLRSLPREARAAAVEETIAAGLSLGAARARVERFYEQTSGLRAGSAAVVALALGVAPLLSERFGFERMWLLLLAAVYVATWVTAALFFRAHRRLFPEARLERWGHTALITLVPVSAMRATDVLARRALHGVHPLAAAAAMVPKERLARVAGHLLRDARWPLRPICPSHEPEAQATESFWRAAVGRRLAALVQEVGLDPEALAALPRASSEAPGERCCPRCHAWYAEGAAACEDCGGIPLGPSEAELHRG